MEWTKEDDKWERKSYREAIEPFYPSAPFPEHLDWKLNKDDFKKYSCWDNPKKLEFGDHFLFQILKYSTKGESPTMTYPQMGLFVRYNFCDQALQYDYILPERSWAYRKEYKTREDAEYEVCVAEREIEIDSHIEWNDSIYIFGVWKSKPTWQQMKNKYYNTIWYHRTEEDKRRIRLNELL